jgi:hypothetical protein
MSADEKQEYKSPGFMKLIGIFFPVLLLSASIGVHRRLHEILEAAAKRLFGGKAGCAANRRITRGD